eukprot:6554337-Pyramimonas_sp.AAC.1
MQEFRLVVLVRERVAVRRRILTMWMPCWRASNPLCPAVRAVRVRTPFAVRHPPRSQWGLIMIFCFGASREAAPGAPNGGRSRADVWTQIWNVLEDTFPGLAGLTMVKIKAHSAQHLNSDDSGVSFLARGNNETDEAAREWVDLAPRP